jgi:hypothetical protein
MRPPPVGAGATRAVEEEISVGKARRVHERRPCTSSRDGRSAARKVPTRSRNARSSLQPLGVAFATSQLGQEMIGITVET